MSKPGEVTRARILAVAMRIAVDGLHCVTVRYLGRMASVDHSVIMYHFESVKGLHNAIALEAIRTGNVKIIARLIIDNHEAVQSMTRGQRIDWLVKAVP